MPLSQKQKLIRDKKVAELNQKINNKQSEIDRITTDKNVTITKIQEEKDEAELIKQALEELK